jgi:hypothetical protein
MATDKMNFASIAQALKHQIRSGAHWNELTPASKEALDQIATSIARTVSGDGLHWDGIIGFAQAARLGTDDPNAVPPPRATIELEHGIRNLVRELPRNGNA